MRFYRTSEDNWYCQECIDEGVLGNINEDEFIIDSDTDRYHYRECDECGLHWDDELEAYVDTNGYEWDSKYGFKERRKKNNGS